MPGKNITFRNVKKAYTNSDGSTTIEYDDGTKKTVYSLPNKEEKQPLVVAGSKTKDKKTYSSSISSNSSYSSGNYNSGYSSYSYSSNKPTEAFTAFGIDFWGSPKHKLDDITFKEGDLIINCTGIKWTPKPKPKPKLFGKEVPEWLNIPEVLLKPTAKYNNGHLAEQLVLDWPDMKEPPADADLEFWSEILIQCQKNNIKRIFCCCTAGQGRTGTALASFLLASGIFDEPDMAIDYIRDNYNSKAIETKGQEQYIFELVYQPIEDN